MKQSYSVSGSTIVVEADSVEHGAQRLARHFSRLARLAGDKSEGEFAEHPDNIDYVPPAPAGETQEISAEDVGELKPGG
jgi:hypothetical protein